MNQMVDQIEPNDSHKKRQEFIFSTNGLNNRFSVVIPSES